MKGSDAGRRRQREPYVGARLVGQWVDVRFGDTQLSVIVTDGDGRDTVVPVANRPDWELTGAEFSRLPGVRNTTAAEAVNPVVAGWSEGHTGVAVDPGQSGAAANVITGPRPAAAPAPSPGWATWAGVDEFLQSTEAETEAGAGGVADEVALHEWWAREPSSPGEAGQASGVGVDGSLAGDGLGVWADATGVEDLDGAWCPAEAFAVHPIPHEDSVAFSPIEGRRPRSSTVLADTTATIGQVLRGADPRRDPRSGDVPTKRSAWQAGLDGQAGLDRATASSSRDGQPGREGQPGGKRRAVSPGSTEPAGPDHGPAPDRSAQLPDVRLPDPHTTTAAPLPPPPNRPNRPVDPVDPNRPMVVTRTVDTKGCVNLGKGSE